MENKLITYILEYKWFLIFYLIWILIHMIFLLSGDGGDGIWPFSSNGFDLYDYGAGDFVFWLMTPLIIFAIYKLSGKDIKITIQDKK
jgi:hypothetical protein